MKNYKISAQYLYNQPAIPKKHRDMGFEYRLFFKPVFLNVLANKRYGSYEKIQNFCSISLESTCY